MEIVFIALLGFVAGAVIMWAASSVSKTKLEAEFKEREAQLRKNVSDETVKGSRAAIKGQIGERFAPFVEGFGYEPADARFVGSPIDHVVFDGLSEGEIRGIAFVEVKTDGAWLTPFQKQVQEAVEARRVTWRVVQL